MIEDEHIRKEILSITSSIIPYDQMEQQHQDFVKTWIASGAEIFRIAKPDKPNIHLVSYFVIIDPLTNEFLLTDHKKAGLWLPPGGHVEIGEHPRETVKREIQEELGIEAQFLLVNPLFVTVTDTVGNVARHTDVSLWYVLRGNKSDLIKFDSEEFHQIQWFRSNDVPYDRSDPHMRRFVEKAMNKIKTLNSYDISVSQYARNTANLHPEKEAAKFIESLPARAKIIDIGCGPGRDAKVFSNHGFDVIGIDFSSKMIEAARQNVPHSTFFVMDIETLAFPSESFDGIWASSVLLHVSKKNARAVLQKLYAILKPNGLLYLSVKQSHPHELLEGDARYDGLEKYWSFYEKDELIHLLRQENFEIAAETTTGKIDDYQTHPIIKIFALKSQIGGNG